MGKRKIGRETSVGERDTGEKERERDSGEKEREIQGRKRGRDRGERERERGERNNYKHKKIHGILSCRATIH